jgi:hypothetical protein
MAVFLKKLTLGNIFSWNPIKKQQWNALSWSQQKPDHASHILLDMFEVCSKLLGPQDLKSFVKYQATTATISFCHIQPKYSPRPSISN